MTEERSLLESTSSESARDCRPDAERHPGCATAPEPGPLACSPAANKKVKVITERTHDVRDGGSADKTFGWCFIQHIIEAGPLKQKVFLVREDSHAL